MKVLLPGLLLLVACPSTRGSPLHDQLESEVIALHQKVRSLEAALETCGDDRTAGPIYQELHQILSDTRVRVGREGPATTLLFPADLLFRDELEIRTEARMPLDLLATALAKHTDHRVIVEGHTDARPLSGDLQRRYRDHWGVAYARAEAVMRSLVEDFEVPEERFTVTARAHHDPVATNDTEAGQRQNRRVLVRVEPPIRGAAPQ